MKKTLLLSPIIIAIFSACGPSAEEAAAIQETIFARQKATQDSTDAVTANQEALKAQLIDLKGELAGQESKLNSTEEFKLLRTADEKAAQIAEQTKIVEELKAKIAEVESQILQ